MNNIRRNVKDSDIDQKWNNTKALIQGIKNKTKTKIDNPGNIVPY